MLRNHGSANNARAGAIATAYASALGVPVADVQAEVATDNGDTVAQLRVLLSKTFCLRVSMLFCTKVQLVSVLESVDFHKRVSASLRLQGACSQHKECVKRVSRASVQLYADGTTVMVDNLHSGKMMVPLPNLKVVKHVVAPAPTPSPLAMSDEVASIVKAVRASPAALAVSASAGVLLLCTLLCCCRGHPAQKSAGSPTRRGNRADGYSHVQMPEYHAPDVYGAADPRLALQSRAAAMYGARDLQAMAF